MRMEGSCKYCGQIINVEAETQTEADEKATMECGCGAAKLAQKRNRNISEAKELILSLFPDADEDAPVIVSLHRMVDEIGSGRYSGVSVQLDGCTTCKISRTVKGNIKVTRTDHQQQSYETVE